MPSIGISQWASFQPSEVFEANERAPPCSVEVLPLLFVRSAQLRSMQDITDSYELKIVKGVDTCWLSHKAAVSVLLRSLAAVFVTLQQLVDPTAVGLRTVLARQFFCLTVTAE